MTRGHIPTKSRKLRGIFCLLPAALVLLTLSGCGRGASSKPEIAYVSAVEATLRDRLSAVYNKTGTVNNGEQVQVLERSHNGRFARVRDDRNEEGWLEVRYLAPATVYTGFQALAQQNAALPVQAAATTRAALNMHLEPTRESEHLFQLPEGAKVEILKRATAAKPAPLMLVAAANGATAPPPSYEDWWLIRDANHRYGWVLARMVDLDTPLDVAQYAEGQRIVAYFILNTVSDKGKQVPQYLLLLNDPADGQPQDFDQLRVFTWGARRGHYETAFRERVKGMLPARVGTQDFGKEGTLPVFTVLLLDAGGQTSERTYKMNGVMVRPVLAPGQAPAKPARRRRKAGR